MTQAQRIHTAAQSLGRTAPPPPPSGGFLARLLRSLRIRITPTTNPRRPISKIEITGQADF